MNRFLFLSFCAAAALLVPTLCTAGEVFPAVHSEPITVRLLSGRDGRPQPWMHVVLIGGYDRRDLARGQWREEGMTDALGNLRLSNGLRNLPWLQLSVRNGHACAPGAARAVFSLELIRRDGVSVANRCGGEAIPNSPGVLTFYVKGKKTVIRPAGVDDADPVLISEQNLNRELSQGQAARKAADPFGKPASILAASPAAGARPADVSANVPPLTDAEIGELAAERP
jgi:hypothetical protein